MAPSSSPDPQPSKTADPSVTATSCDPAPPAPQELLAAGVELLVFAPLGFALKARTLVPELVQAGRLEWQRRSTVARFVGKMVVDGGKHNLQQRRSAPLPTAAPAPVSSSAPASSAATPTAPAAAPKKPASKTPVPKKSAPKKPAPKKPAPKNAGPKVGRPRATAVSSSDSLPIAGYDTLATQSIVELLSGLDAAGLRAIEQYEGAHRGRRTVLARVAQLRAAT